MKKLLLILFALMFSLPCEASLSHNTHLTHTGLKPVPNSFQVAKSHFLPEYQTGAMDFIDNSNSTDYCPVSLYEYTAADCPAPKVTANRCPGSDRYSQCNCPGTYVSEEDCTAQGKVTDGTVCNGDNGTKYPACKCPDNYGEVTADKNCSVSMCRHQGVSYCPPSALSCKNSFKLCGSGIIAASGASACTDNQGTKYSACSCDTSVYGKTDDICQREVGKNAVVSGARCPIDSQYGTDCSCTVTCDPGFSTTPCGAMGEAATTDDGCGGKCYKCNTVACDEAGTCETGCPVPTNVGATTVTSCSQLTDAIAAKAENIIIGANFSCSSPVTLSNCQNLVGSGFFDGSANKTLTFSVGTGSGIKIPSSAYIANLDLKASSKRTSGNHGVIQLTSSSSKLTLKDTNISYSLFSDSYNNNGSYGYAGICGDYKTSRVSFVGKNTIISNNPSVYYNYAIHLASVVMKEDSSLKASTTGYGGYLIIGGASVTFGKNSVIDLKSTGTYGIGIDFVSKIDMAADNATLNITTSGSDAFAFRHREEDTKINMGSTAVMNLNASAGMFDMETTNSNKFTMTAKLGAQVDNKGTVYTCTTEVKGDKITAVNTLPPGFTHCSGSNYCGYLCVKDNRPKQTVYENITTGLIGDNTCVNSFFAYDSRDFNGNTITLKNITTHLKVNRPDSGSFWPYSKRAYLALIYGDTVYLEGTHNLTLEGAVDFAACGTGCNIRSKDGAKVYLNGMCYYLPPGYHYQCSGNCFEKTPPNASSCN